eukprot:CAMPEP_0172836384 /NCGR_PEP_ID=MMETSP1075-20121228/26439_1 /TAXON_ID=2916 /ORGANISM="Ceratium fusus, Strain PA161109" /LENGTH=241 /DNA_ID=CAMNT_0013679601 /DNA_START=35 /DNA_END=761 /DNA_ORIENTATION=-
MLATQINTPCSSSSSSSSSGINSLHHSSGMALCPQAEGIYISNGSMVGGGQDLLASKRAQTVCLRGWHPQDVARGAAVATIAALVACGPGLALQWLASALTLDSPTTQLESTRPRLCHAIVGAVVAIAAGSWLLQFLADFSDHYAAQRQPPLHNRLLDNLRHEAYCVSQVESPSPFASVHCQQQRRVASPAWLPQPWQRKRPCPPVQKCHDDLQLQRQSGSGVSCKMPGFVAFMDGHEADN